MSGTVCASVHRSRRPSGPARTRAPISASCTAAALAVCDAFSSTCPAIDLLSTTAIERPPPTNRQRAFVRHVPRRLSVKLSSERPAPFEDHRHSSPPTHRHHFPALRPGGVWRPSSSSFLDATCSAAPYVFGGIGLRHSRSRDTRGAPGATPSSRPYASNGRVPANCAPHRLNEVTPHPRLTPACVLERGEHLVHIAKPPGTLSGATAPVVITPRRLSNRSAWYRSTSTRFGRGSADHRRGPVGSEARACACATLRGLTAAVGAGCVRPGPSAARRLRVPRQ